MQLTYQQLNQRANQLACHLQQLGVGPETLVGLYQERCFEMVIAILGILKAGGAYVPIDPGWPSDRVAFILADTHAPVVLTQTHLAEGLPPHAAQVVYLDADWDSISNRSTADLPGELEPSSLMYVIYTSGSTGQPKGVMIPHSGIYNQLHWRQTTFPLTAVDRVLQNISVSFDPSVWQIFWPLCCGAQLVLPRPGGQQDVAYLVELIATEQISAIALVPSLLRVFLEAKHLHRCTALRHVFCGGEALTLDLENRFFQQFPAQAQLHNVYGPTEASIDATCWTCQPGSTLPAAPIGRPISHAQVYVLNEQGQPVLTGEPGELYIGGAGLARGYLNRPDLTAAKFVAAPFGLTPTAYLYKTGDLARYLPDGSLEFLGRIDYQVKIRGFRIELGEIEAALNSHPQVRQSVVIAREDEPGRKRLVAYFVSEPEAWLSTAAVRSFLQKTLPDYMVPAVFVPLERLPLNPNGKVDRKALPDPSCDRPDSSGPLATAQTPLQQTLVDLWQATLRVHPIGIQDNFFDLGGNSLLATQLLSELAEVVGQQWPTSVLFKAPTIEQLSALLQTNEQPAEEGLIIPIRASGSRPPLFCLHTRTGQIFEYYRLARHLDPDQPVYGLRTSSMGELLAYQQIEAMASRYCREIQAFQPEGPYYLCGYSFGGLLAYEIARQLLCQGKTIGSLLLVDTYNTPNSWFVPLAPHRRLQRHLENLLALKPRDQLTYIRQKLLPHQPKRGSAAYLFAAANTHLEALTALYRPQPYPGLATLFKATKPPSKQFVQPTLSDPCLGWSDLIEHLQIETIASDHFGLFQEPDLLTLAAQCQAHLDQAQAKAIESDLQYMEPSSRV